MSLASPDHLSVTVFLSARLVLVWSAIIESSALTYLLLPLCYLLCVGVCAPLRSPSGALLPPAALALLHRVCALHARGPCQLPHGRFRQLRRAAQRPACASAWLGPAGSRQAARRARARRGLLNRTWWFDASHGEANLQVQ